MRQNIVGMSTYVKYQNALPPKINLQQWRVYCLRVWPRKSRELAGKFRRSYATIASAQHYAFESLGAKTDGVAVRACTLRMMAEKQKLIREAWAGEKTAIEELENALSAEVSLSIGAKEIEIRMSNLWALTRLLFLRDFATKKIRVCANHDCPAPYFLESRRGQKFCSHACAVLINVRRFREREAKRSAGRSNKKVDRRQRHVTLQT